MDISGGKFGDADKTEQTLCWTVLMELERACIIAKEQEAELESLKKK